MIIVRPEHIRIDDANQGYVHGRIVESIYGGSETRLLVQLQSGAVLTVRQVAGPGFPVYRRRRLTGAGKRNTRCCWITRHWADRSCGNCTQPTQHPVTIGETRVSAIIKASRRQFIKTTGAAGLALGFPTIWTQRANAAETLTIADNGGALGPIMRAAFYDPFEKETGIGIVNVAHESDPVTQFKLSVDSGSHIWGPGDGNARQRAAPHRSEKLSGPARHRPERRQGHYPRHADQQLVRLFHLRRGDGVSHGQVSQGLRPPVGQDYWDIGKFPGRRALFRSPIGLFENALLADGVARRIFIRST